VPKNPPLTTSRREGPAADAVPDDATRLQMTTTRLSRRLRQEAGAPLTPSQLSVMASIHRNGPITLGALAECERVAPPTITRVVAKLEADGLVERHADPHDRRVTRVVTTERGAELITDSRARKVAWLAERLDQLPARDRARIAAALDALERLVAVP
jgi:DNA-binding MarR family transcriptional regulator